MALRTKLPNAKGVLTTVYAVIDGIDDQGEDVTIYGRRGSPLAHGDDYRGLEWSP